ncbi:hypothetical protein FRB98_009695 [Tulasnella sp. 332]|nr:hypothetical protein FRB98_009695 [Tulasnella sp. 332]
MWKLQDDNLFQTSSNGNDYNLTTYGNPEYNIPYPGDSIYLAVDIKFPEPISNPDAGQNLQLVDTGITAVKPEFAIQWDYYNTANALGHGISNILMEFVQKSNKSTGYISAGVFPVNSSSLSVNYPYGADTVDQEGLCVYDFKLKRDIIDEEIFFI